MEEIGPLLEWQEIHDVDNRNAIEAFRGYRTDLCASELDPFHIQGFAVLNFFSCRINSQHQTLCSARTCGQKRDQESVPTAHIQNGCSFGDGVYDWSERAGKISDHSANPPDEPTGLVGVPNSPEVRALEVITPEPQFPLRMQDQTS